MQYNFRIKGHNSFVGDNEWKSAISYRRYESWWFNKCFKYGRIGSLINYSTATVEMECVGQIIVQYWIIQ